MDILAKIEALLPASLLPYVARIKASPLGCRLARGAFWSLLGAVLARGFGVVSSILVARMLGKSGYGELGIIQSTVGMFGTFAGFGLGMTATKFIAEYRTTDPEKAGRVRALSGSFAWVSSGCTSLILYLMAPWLAEHVLAAPKLSGLLQVAALLLFLTAINGAQIGALSGFEAFKTVAKISVWCGMANFPLMVGGVYFAGLTGAVWGMVAATGVNWMLNHMAIRAECTKAGVPYSYKGCWAENPILWKFALPSLISSVFFAPTEWALNAMLVNQPGGYGQMGIFNAANLWQNIIIYFPLMLSNITLPILANLLGENKREQYNKMLYFNAAGFTGLGVLFCIPVALLSKKIMSSYGSGFADGWPVLVMMSLCAVFYSLLLVIGQAMWTTGASVEAMAFAALRSLILVVSGSFLVKYGAIGLASAFLITYIIQTIYLIPYARYKCIRLFSVEAGGGTGL